MHLIFLVALSLCLFQDQLASLFEPLAADSLNDYMGRVINGSKVKKGKYKFMASIQRDGRHFCGGTVINDNTILTAAHCLTTRNGSPSGTTGVTVELGGVKLGSGTLTIKAARFEHHKGFVRKKFGDGFDVAVVKLDGTIDFDKYKDSIEKVCLAGPDAEPAKKKCVGMGWGEGSGGVLQMVDLPLTDPNYSECQEGSGKGHNVSALICGSRKGGNLCKGDSGGPYVCPEKTSGELLQFGITSYATRRLCWDPEWAVMFTRVSAFIDWIRPRAED